MFVPLGSPPRVRGKVHDKAGIKLHRRITPACAGKRIKCHLFRQSFQDHPRVCGEKKRLTAGKTAGTGSPPRVRGKVP